MIGPKVYCAISVRGQSRLKSPLIVRRSNAPSNVYRNDVSFFRDLVLYFKYEYNAGQHSSCLSKSGCV